MHAWLWAERYPDAMDAVIPLAAQPTEMASRNWILRRLITDSIRRDPRGKTATTVSSRPAHTLPASSTPSPPAGNASLAAAGADLGQRSAAAGAAPVRPFQRRRQRSAVPVGRLARLPRRCASGAGARRGAGD
ncbi:hypothetical protein N4G58_00795 [Edwardsiella piscicida]|nr:hypothetical protein N4G58_00795 [Edwardsiella piscicida]